MQIAAQTVKISDMVTTTTVSNQDLFIVQPPEGETKAVTFEKLIGERMNAVEQNIEDLDNEGLRERDNLLANRFTITDNAFIMQNSAYPVLVGIKDDGNVVSGNNVNVDNIVSNKGFNCIIKYAQKENPSMSNLFAGKKIMYSSDKTSIQYTFWNNAGSAPARISEVKVTNSQFNDIIESISLIEETTAGKVINVYAGVHHPVRTSNWIFDLKATDPGTNKYVVVTLLYIAENKSSNVLWKE